MCLLAAGEPGSCRREEGRDAHNCARHLRGGGTDVGERRSRGSVAGLGCPAGGTAAALPLIAGRRVSKGKKKINKKISPANSTVPARGAAGSGDSLLLPGSPHSPWGEHPTGDSTSPAELFPCVPPIAKRCYWDPRDSAG